MRVIICPSELLKGCHIVFPARAHATARPRSAVELFQKLTDCIADRPGCRAPSSMKLDFQLHGCVAGRISVRTEEDIPFNLQPQGVELDRLGLSYRNAGFN